MIQKTCKKTTIPSVITKWDNDVPICCQLPWSVTRKKKCSPMMSENKRTRKNMAEGGIRLIFCTTHTKQATTKKGMRTFIRRRDPIKKGLNTDTKVWIDFGSKLFKLAMFPVPKNETTEKKRNIKALVISFKFITLRPLSCSITSLPFCSRNWAKS